VENAGILSRVPVYHGADLLPGCRVEGPCVVEEHTTTILVHPGDALGVDASDTLVIEIDTAQPRPESERQHEVAL